MNRLFLGSVVILLALSAACGGGSDSRRSALYVVNADGTELRELWVSSGEFMSFAWSPDGTAVAASAWPDAPRLIDIKTGEESSLEGAGRILGSTPDRLYAVQDNGHVALVPADGGAPSFRAQGSEITWTEAEDVAFIYTYLEFGHLGHLGVSIAGRGPAGWTEVARYPTAALIAIDPASGRYALTESASASEVILGEVITEGPTGPVEVARRIPIPSASAGTRLDALVLSPGATRLALLRSEEGEIFCFDSFDGRVCSPERIDLRLALVDIATGRVSQTSPSPPGTAFPSLSWRDDETLIWGPSAFEIVPPPSSAGLGIAIETTTTSTRPTRTALSPDGKLLANFVGSSGLKVWPASAGETGRDDHLVGMMVVRFMPGIGGGHQFAWSPDGSQLAVAISQIAGEIDRPVAR